MKLAAWSLTTLAIVVWVAGIGTGLYIVNIPSVLPAATLGLQSPATKFFWDTLVSVFQMMGVLMSVSAAMLGGLLLGSTLLLLHSQALTVRIQRLEMLLDRTADLEGTPHTELNEVQP